MVENISFIIFSLLSKSLAWITLSFKMFPSMIDLYLPTTWLWIVGQAFPYNCEEISNPQWGRHPYRVNCHFNWADKYGKICGLAKHWNLKKEMDYKSISKDGKSDKTAVLNSSTLSFDKHLHLLLSTSPNGSVFIRTNSQLCLCLSSCVIVWWKKKSPLYSTLHHVIYIYVKQMLYINSAFFFF